jgi:putative restriction endonuclease
MPNRRSPKIEESPHAHQWLLQNSAPAKNFYRIRDLLCTYYAGANHGYIDRREPLAEYRFDPVAEDLLLNFVYISARAKHSLVRFYINDQKLKGPWKNRWRVLKSATGTDLAAVDFTLTSDAKLDELETFIRTTKTFSGRPSLPQSTKSSTPDKKNWFHAAGIVWPLLTAAAARGTTVTYGDIAPHIQTNALSVGRALGPIQDYCLQSQLPPLTAIVVGKISGEPGGGFVAWDTDDMDSAHEMVFDFKWPSINNPFQGFGESDTIDSFASAIVGDPKAAADVYRKVRVRGVAQQIFRRALMTAYECRCAFCGFGFAAALEAAHIISWEEATAAQRLDPTNGMLLCSSHHKLVDAGLMTISRSLKVVYYDPEMEEDNYSESDEALTARLHGQSIHLPKEERHRPNPEYLRAAHEKVEWGDLP